MAKAALAVWILVAGYFGILGWGAIPQEGDSLAYHIPIARMINGGKWTGKTAFAKPWFYYPAMGETLLAGWTGLGLPANWFNLLGWVFLTGVVYGLGRNFGLSKESALMAGLAVVLWPSVVRLIPTQTVDIWVAVWWGAAMMKVSGIRYQISEKQKNNYLLWTGIYLGMLVGTKYSGLLFALVLVGIFRKKLRSNILMWLVPMVFIGGFWYLRNWVLVGNPVYPMDISWLGWRGIPDLTLFTGKPWMTLFARPGLFLQSLFSEYLLWAGVLLAPVWLRSKWAGIGILNFAVYLLLPSRPENMVSDLRYAYPAFIPLLLAVWRKMEEVGRGEMVKLAAVLMMAAELTQLDYHPKTFVFLILFITLIFNQSSKLKMNND